MHKPRPICKNCNTAKTRWNDKICRKCIRKYGRRIRYEEKKENFYGSEKWMSLRYDILKKYGRKCMVCFITNTELHVDHIKPRSKYPELELDPDNLQVLCKACNLGKSNTDEIDWR